MNQKQMIMQNFLGIHHGGFSVPNLEATIQWYVDKLGFQRGFVYSIPSDKPTKAGFVTMGDFRLEFVEVTGSDAMPAEREALSSDLQTQGMKHIALRVADIEKTKVEMEAKGIEFVMPILNVPNSHGEKFVYFYDNNKVLVELYQPL